MPQPICFIDNKYYDCGRYPEIVRAFADYPNICSVHQRVFQFKIVGVLCAEGQPIIVFPKNYETFGTEEDLVPDAKLLARVLIRYRNEVHNTPEEIQLLIGDSNMSSGRIAAAMFLLDDYCQNGYLRRQSVVSAVKTVGRTDWAATVNKLHPIITNGNLLYPYPIMRRRKSDDNNIVVLAHKYVINECFREWGWFFGYDEVSERIQSLPTSLEEVIRSLRKELRQTYLEREIQVIRHLIQYLEERVGNDKQQKLDIMATPYFSFVWESICGYIMNNQYARLKTLLPQPVWESDLVDGHISQRPDIFMVRNQGLYILDAKYYDYNRNVPGWHDVVKQLFYRHTMKSIQHSREFMRTLPNTREIYNAFLFPGNDSDFQYVGRVHVPRVADLGEIRAFAVDQRKAMSAYAYRNDHDFPELIRESITAEFTH